jgi:hypothetical protein
VCDSPEEAILVAANLYQEWHSNVKKINFKNVFCIEFNYRLIFSFNWFKYVILSSVMDYNPCFFKDFQRHIGKK